MRLANSAGVSSESVLVLLRMLLKQRRAGASLARFVSNCREGVSNEPTSCLCSKSTALLSCCNYTSKDCAAVSMCLILCLVSLILSRFKR